MRPIMGVEYPRSRSPFIANRRAAGKGWMLDLLTSIRGVMWELLPRDEHHRPGTMGECFVGALREVATLGSLRTREIFL